MMRKSLPTFISYLIALTSHYSFADQALTVQGNIFRTQFGISTNVNICQFTSIFHSNKYQIQAIWQDGNRTVVGSDGVDSYRLHEITASTNGPSLQPSFAKISPCTFPRFSSEAIQALWLAHSYFVNANSVNTCSDIVHQGIAMTNGLQYNYVNLNPLITGNYTNKAEIEIYSTFDYPKLPPATRLEYLFATGHILEHQSNSPVRTIFNTYRPTFMLKSKTFEASFMSQIKAKVGRNLTPTEATLALCNYLKRYPEKVFDDIVTETEQGGSIVIVATNVATALHELDFRPRISNHTIVYDYRLLGNRSKFATYSITNNIWLSKSDVLDREHSGHALTTKRLTGSPMVRPVFYALFLAILFLLFALICRQLPSIKNKQKQ